MRGLYRGTGDRFRLSIFVLVGFLSLFSSLNSFARRPSDCENSLLVSDRTRVIDKFHGINVWDKILKLEKDLPSDLNSLMEMFPEKTIPELAHYILKQQKRQEKILLVLAKLLPKEEDILIQTLRNSARLLAPADKTWETLNSVKSAMLGQYFPHSLKPKDMTPEVMNAFFVLTSWMGRSNGALGELKVAFNVPDLNQTGSRVYQLVPEEHQEKVLELVENYKGDAMSLEIDVVFNEGQVWGEVKNYKKTVTPAKLKPLLARARVLVKMSKFLKKLGHPNEIAYFFLRGGITPSGRKLLEDIGVKVYDGRDLAWE